MESKATTKTITATTAILVDTVLVGHDTSASELFSRWPSHEYLYIWAFALALSEDFSCKMALNQDDFYLSLVAPEARSRWCVKTENSETKFDGQKEWSFLSDEWIRFLDVGLPKVKDIFFGLFLVKASYQFASKRHLVIFYFLLS